MNYKRRLSPVPSRPDYHVNPDYRRVSRKWRLLGPQQQPYLALAPLDPPVSGKNQDKRKVVSEHLRTTLLLSLLGIELIRENLKLVAASGI